MKTLEKIKISNSCVDESNQNKPNYGMLTSVNLTHTLLNHQLLPGAVSMLPRYGEEDSFLCFSNLMPGKQ